MSSYSKISKKYEDSLNSEYKKNNGIFYTDITLAKNIINFLNIPQTSSILDPFCGTGSFLLSAKELGYSSIYGADKDKQAVLIAKETTGINSLRAMDTLANNGTKTLNDLDVRGKIDFVIGNPPYATASKDRIIDTSDTTFLRNVRTSGKNLFVAAIYRAFELANDHGIISYIVPKNFLHVSAYSALRKYILQKKRIISIVNIGSHFKNVRGEQIILTIENSYTADNVISFYNYIDDQFVRTINTPQQFYNDEILMFENAKDNNIYKSFNSSYKKIGDVCSGYVGRGKSKLNSAIKGKDICKFSFKNREVPLEGNKIFIQNIYSSEAGVIASFAGDLEATQTVTVLTDGSEKMCRYLLGILHSRLCNYYLLKFCFNNSKMTMHTDAKYLKKIPLVIDETTFDKIITCVRSLEITDYMSANWFKSLEMLNDLVYRTYKIEKNDQEYIDLEIKNIQSRKWNNDK